MNIRPIKTEQDYNDALERVSVLMNAEPGSADDEELDVLATLVSAYEDEHFPIEAPDPVEAIRFRMEQKGIERKDLEPYLGSRSKVSEVLSGKRNLTMKQVKRLHKGLQIPYENLMGAA
jgi:HTH-type transcriptional regulator / antitoxin HigA